MFEVAGLTVISLWDEWSATAMSSVLVIQYVG